MPDETPRGPLGFGRLTDVGPFSSKEVEIEEEFSEDHSPLIETHIERFFYEADKDIPESRGFRRRVVVKQKPDKTGVDILDNIASEVAELGEGIADIYYLTFENGWGYIVSTNVDRRFRRRGIATELREDAFEHMRELGVDEVYSYPASNDGVALVESTGFRDTGVSVGPNNMWVKEL